MNPDNLHLALSALLAKHPTEGAWDSSCFLCAATTPCGRIPHAADCPFTLAREALAAPVSVEHPHIAHLRSTGWLDPMQAAGLKSDVLRLKEQLREMSGDVERYNKIQRDGRITHETYEP